MIYSELFAKAKNYAVSHKITTAILVVVIAAGGYWSYSAFKGAGSAIKYVTAAAAKGTIVASISGSGQVSASNQVDIKPKASGDVIYVGIQPGQFVWAGTLIAQLDSSDAQKSVRDAELNLESARLSMEKLQSSSADMNQIAEDSFTTVANTFLDLPKVVTGANTILNSNTLDASQSNYGYYTDFLYSYDRDKIDVFLRTAKNDYDAARAKYDAAFLLYKNTTRYAGIDENVKLLNQTADAVKAVSQALKSEQNLLDFLSDYATDHNKKLPSSITAYQSDLRGYIQTANSQLSSLTNAKNSVENVSLDLKSQELSLSGRENALEDAKEKLADYYIRAPFSGVIAKVSVKKSDSASSGSAIATIVTKQQIAEISLNEVDVAKVKAGQKATLTFDAVSGLTVTGTVASVDGLGTVTQGVVTYAVKINFDAQDERVKPGMSVSAAIITDVKQDILMVPSGAVKFKNDEYYVEFFDSEVPATASIQGFVSPVLPCEKTVQIGLSNDTETEIISGLNEGENIVVRTITATQQTTTTAASSLFGGSRTTGASSGNAARIMR